MSAAPFAQVEAVLERFRELRGVVTPVTARLRGGWSRVPEPDHPELVSWRYEGMFEAPVPIVGLLLLCRPDAIEWIRTPSSFEPTGASLDLLVHGWMSSRPYVSVFARLQSMERSVFVKDVGEPPAACPIREGEVEAGAAYEVFRMDDKLRCVVVLLANDDVRSARFSGWRLHEPLASRLSPSLARWLTHKRSGTSTFGLNPSGGVENG